MHHLQGLRTLNANRHLARSVTFEAVICKVLLYWEVGLEFVDFAKLKILECKIDAKWQCSKSIVIIHFLILEP